MYLAIACLLAVLMLLAYGIRFEKNKYRTRRLILIAIFVAMSVVGRLIPIFKPVTAFTILGAMYLGGEAGFLIGGLSAVISNFYFGQGPWTPFQILAWGSIGLLAGAMAGVLKRRKGLLLGMGAFAGVWFSMVMDVFTVLWYNGSFSLALYSAAVVSALPFTAVYAVSNALFLAIGAKPIGEKLERIQKKYGL